VRPESATASTRGRRARVAGPIGLAGTGEERSSKAIATFTSKGHDLFATVHGRLSVDTDLAVVDRFWTRFVAAWYEGGRDDPTLTLLRLDAQQAEILEESSSLVAGIKMLFGADPKQDYKDKVAKVRMR